METNNKLGLKIVRISNGYTDLLEINGNPFWTKKLWDIREDLKLIGNLNSSSNLMFVKNIEEGHILTIIYPFMIHGHGSTDSISAWIYIPKDILISGKELIEVINYLREVILSNDLNKDTLSRYFDKQYPAATAKRIIVASSGTACAYRYYGQGEMYSLSEILSELNQPHYGKYKCVFILDKASGVQCTGGVNLSSNMIIPMVVIDPPKKVNGFVPHINGVPFTEAIYMGEGNNFKVEWKRSGYRTIEQSLSASSKTIVSEPTPDKYFKYIRFDHFNVTDEKTGSVITRYQLRINKQNLTEGYQIAVNEAVIGQCEVEIFAEDYKTYKQTLDLATKRTIRLQKKTLTYAFRMPRIDQVGQYVDFDLPMTQKLTECPIAGYKTEEPIEAGHPNYLVYSPNGKRTYILLLISFLIGLFIGIGTMWIFDSDDPAPQAPVVEAKKATADQGKGEGNGNDTGKDTVGNGDNTESTSATESTSEAINYLDNNKQWNKKKMEEIDELKGLWDAMNTYNFAKIKEFKDKLSGSNKYNELFKAVENSTKTGIQFTTNDIITFDSYISRVQPASKTENGSKKGTGKAETSGNGSKKEGDSKALDDAEQPTNDVI